MFQINSWWPPLLPTLELDLLRKRKIVTSFLTTLDLSKKTNESPFLLCDSKLNILRYMFLYINTVHL